MPTNRSVATSNSLGRHNVEARFDVHSSSSPHQFEAVRALSITIHAHIMTVSSQFFGLFVGHQLLSPVSLLSVFLRLGGLGDDDDFMFLLVLMHLSGVIN